MLNIYHWMVYKNRVLEVARFNLFGFLNIIRIVISQFIMSIV